MTGGPHGVAHRRGVVGPALLVLAGVLLATPLAPLDPRISAAIAAEASPTQSTARAALETWKAAVRTGDAETVAALLPEGTTIRVRAVAGPGGERNLDGPALRAALEAGEWDALGLDRHLLLPRARDLRKDGKDRMRAADPRCPEVTWVFARVGGAWRLVEVVRTYLAC